MLFHTPTFLLFVIAVAAFYYRFPRARLYILGLANLVFYMYAGIGYGLLFFLIVSVIYFLSKQFGKSFGRPAFHAGWLIAFGNLLAFKYSMFLLDNAERLLGFHLALEGTLLEDRSIALPIGISFYTFQLLAYLIDVYNGKLQPCRSLLQFWAFISFFAHSAAGPILRGRDFFPQLEHIRRIRFKDERIKLGLTYIAVGLFKKLVLVASIEPLVTDYFNKAAKLNGGEAWIASYLFAFQIYLDFSAYSEMAVGIGHLFGLRLDLNFRSPYLSANAAQFWRRWHITLSQWIRDYIFIPLGGSRVSVWRVYVNLIAAMTLSGLWHGASWTFIIWGLYHGLLAAGHRIYRLCIDRLGIRKWTEFRLYHAVSVFVFFHLTVIGWVFFRAQKFRDAAHMLKAMLLYNPLHTSPELNKLLWIVLLLYGLHIVEFGIVTHFKRLSLGWQLHFPVLLRSLCYTLIIIVLMLYLMKNESVSFIYFQF